MVHIIGVDHLVQYSGPVPEPLRREFRDFLVARGRGLGVGLVAEEFSREALHDVYRAARDTAMEAARRLGVPHRFCDPEEPDMRRLGIPYFAELVELVKKRRGITDRFILDRALREGVRREATELARSHWRTRESFWHDRIAPDIGASVLFICGHEHAMRFRDLVVERGQEARVIEPFWRKDVFSDYANLGLD